MFESFHDEIRREVYKREHLWTLHARPDLGFDDFASECIHRIYLKFHLYDPKKPLPQWLNTVIRNFWINYLRNNLNRYQRPCVRCPLATQDNGCLFTFSTHQETSCPVYARWYKRKSSNFNINLPLSIHQHDSELKSIPDDNIDYIKAKKNLDNQLHKTLNPFQWKIYKLLFIQHKSELEVAKRLGFKPDKAREGCKTIRDAKKIIIEKSKQLLSGGKVDII